MQLANREAPFNPMGPVAPAKIHSRARKERVTNCWSRNLQSGTHSTLPGHSCLSCVHVAEVVWHSVRGRALMESHNAVAAPASLKRWIVGPERVDAQENLMTMHASCTAQHGSGASLGEPGPFA